MSKSLPIQAIDFTNEGPFGVPRPFLVSPNHERFGTLAVFN